MALSTVGSALTQPLAQMLERRLFNIEEKVKNIPIVGSAYTQAKSAFEETAGVGAYSQSLPGQNVNNGSPMDPLINTAGRNADRAAAKLNDLQKQLEAAGDNPPPGLLAKIQIATQAYQAWFTCLKSCADSKGQVQGELARFR